MTQPTKGKDMRDAQNNNDIHEVTARTFDSEVLGADLPVLVEFYSPWCGSCRKIETTLDQLAATFEGRIKFARVNVENDLQLAEAQHVGAVPTLLLFKNGRVLHSFVGQASQGWMEAVLGKVAATTEPCAEALAAA